MFDAGHEPDVADEIKPEANGFVKLRNVKVWKIISLPRGYLFLLTGEGHIVLWVFVAYALDQLIVVQRCFNDQIF